MHETIAELSRTMHVTQFSVMTAISDARVPAPHPHAGRLGLSGTSCQERLLGDDVIRGSRRLYSPSFPSYILFRFWFNFFFTISYLHFNT